MGGEYSAWHGLGILWAPVTPELAAPGMNLEPLPALDPEFADKIRVAVLATATSDWLAAKSSRSAEGFVRPMLDRVLGDCGYVAGSPRFVSYWRNAATDGAWQHERGNPRRIISASRVRSMRRPCRGTERRDSCRRPEYRRRPKTQYSLTVASAGAAIDSVDGSRWPILPGWRVSSGTMRNISAPSVSSHRPTPPGEVARQRG